MDFKDQLIELHAHFSGCMRKETLIEFLQEKQGQDVDISFLQDNSLLGDFKIFSVINSLNLNIAKIKRIAKEIIEDFHKDGVTYLELRATPKKGQDFDQFQYLIAITEVIKEMEQIITVKLIVAIDRAKGVDQAQNTLKLLKNHKIPYLVGIDLCGHPGVGHFKDYVEILQNLRNMGLKITVHTGELNQQIKENDDVLDFAPDRIGHFIYFTEQQLKRVKESKIPIEVCFTSNLCTTSMKSLDHPIRKFIENDIPICICTDDTLCFQTTVSREVKLVQEELGCSVEEMRKILNRSKEYVF